MQSSPSLSGNVRDVPFFFHPGQDRSAESLQRCRGRFFNFWSDRQRPVRNSMAFLNHYGQKETRQGIISPLSAQQFTSRDFPASISQNKSVIFFSVENYSALARSFFLMNLSSDCMLWRTEQRRLLFFHNCAQKFVVVLVPKLQERDGRTGREQILLERRLGERARRVEKTRNLNTGEEETFDNLVSLFPRVMPCVPKNSCVEISHSHAHLF